MNIATEIATPQRAGVTRKAYRLDPPFETDSYDTDLDREVTLRVTHVVLSNNGSEVLAFPGRLRRGLLSGESVSISSWSEVAGMRASGSIRALLAEMGYLAVTDRSGATSIIEPNRTAEPETDHLGGGQ